MVKVESCCFCIDIETGVMLLGTTACLAIVRDLLYFHPVRILLEVALISSFAAMLCKNTALTRLIFLAAYVIHYVGQIAITLFFASYE